MTRRHGLLLIVAALAFFAVVNLPQRTPTIDALPPELLGEPDIYMRDADIIQHEEDGTVRYRLVADEVRHFEGLAVTRLERPRVTMFRPPDLPSHGRAERGELRMLTHPDGTLEEVLYLRDEVVLVQEEHQGSPTTLTTALLHVYPDRRYAETDRPVIIDGNAGRIQGVGLRADLVSSLFNLGADSDERVNTVVQPRPRPAD